MYDMCHDFLGYACPNVAAAAEIDDYLPDFVDAYIAAGLWTGLTDDGEPLDSAGYDGDSLTDEALASIEEDCRAFVTDNWVDLAGMTASQAGHDFLLTRDGHGTGYWDRGLGNRGDRLTAASKPYGESGLYVGDDNQIHAPDDAGGPRTVL